MQYCPMCGGGLRPTFYDEKLPVNECEACGGAWARANEYAIWLKRQAPSGMEQKVTGEVDSTLQIRDSQQAAFCPDCGHFLRRYRVASALDFHLDRCNTCNGVWLDRNEWEALRSVDLHDELRQIFTHPWQERIHDEEVAQKLDRMYLERFGAEDYERIKKLRAWLSDHPNRSTLLAYLMDEDPYVA